MLSGPVRFQLPKRKGVTVGLWGRRGLSVTGPEGKEISLNESQGLILRELDKSPEGLIATELAERLGISHPGVIFLLKPLLSAGVVERASLRGGGVLYYMSTVLREEPSPEVKEAIAHIGLNSGKKIEDLGVKDLARYAVGLPADLRRAVLDWLLIGGIEK